MMRGNGSSSTGNTSLNICSEVLPTVYPTNYPTRNKFSVNQILAIDPLLSLLSKFYLSFIRCLVFFQQKRWAMIQYCLCLWWWLCPCYWLLIFMYMLMITMFMVMMYAMILFMIVTLIMVKNCNDNALMIKWLWQ